MTVRRAAESDVRMMIATQVAYLDGSEGMSVSELVNNTISLYGNQSTLSKKEQAQLDTAQYIQEQIRQHDLQDCYDWVIRDVADDNAQSGFYGCLIDTQDGDAVLGFRGSESFDAGQGLHDWIEADAGLLNSTQTTQQARAEQFTRYVNQRYGRNYDSFSFSGHSLGGNLAEHATITAPEGMSIRRCTSYDGPGYSDEYIAAHRDDIACRAQYIDHYQYSLVGAIMNPLPGTNYRTIAAHNDEGLLGIVVRHHTRNIEFDEYGNVQPGSQDGLAAVISNLTDNIDDVPTFLWAVSPQLAIMWFLSAQAVDFLQSMLEQAGEVIENVGEFLGNLKESVDNWFRSIFGVALTGEFEMSVSYVNSLGEGMDNTAQKLRRISGEISDITSKIRYNSLAGSYIKSRLRSLSSAVSRDAGKASSLAQAVRSCAQYTVSSDTQTAQLYQAI